MFEKWALVGVAALGLIAVFLFNWAFSRSFYERVQRDQLLRAAVAASD